MGQLTVLPGKNEGLRDRIRIARDAAGLSVAELARRVGVSAPSAHNWEKEGKTNPDTDNLIKIAVVTGVAFEWLATGRGPMMYEEQNKGAEPAASYDVLTQDQRELLGLYLKLKPTRRGALIVFLRDFFK